MGSTFVNQRSEPGPSEPGSARSHPRCCARPRRTHSALVFRRMDGQRVQADGGSGRRRLDLLADRPDDALLSIVAARGAGAEDAFAELTRRIVPRLRAMASRLVADRGLADELVQEVLVRLWKLAGRYDATRGSVGAFVTTIARTTAVDLWRRPSSRPMADVGEDPPEPVELGDVDPVLVGMVVRDALGGLSAPQREVLELAYFSGLRQPEIAAKLGVPLGTVKTRTFHALRSLRTVLAAQGVSS